MSLASKKMYRVTDIDLQKLKMQKDLKRELRKKLTLIEEAIKSTESELISMIESGAEVITSLNFRIRRTERRYPSWKASFIEVCGKDLAQDILEATAPVVSKEILID